MLFAYNPRMKMLHRYLHLYAILMLLCVSDLGANETPSDTLIDEVHDDVSQRLSDLIGQIDGFFGDGQKNARDNQSWARVRLDIKKREGDSPEFKANVKLKLILPSTEQRFRLLLSTEDDGREKDNQPGSSPSLPSSTDGNVALALRFLRTARENRSLKFDLGARVRDDKAQAFLRIGGYYRYDLDDNWWGSVNNNAIFFSASGFEDTLTFRFERFIDRSDQVLLLSSSQFAWEEGQKGAAIGQTVGLYRELSNNRSIAVETLAGVLTSPDSGEHRYRGAEFRIRYRQNLWRHWFYYEFWPSVSWPADRGFKATYGGLIRVEAIIGQRKN